MSVSVAVSSLKPQTGFCNKCKKQRAERKTLLKIEGKESWIWFLRNDKIKTMPLKKKKSYFHCRPFFLNISAQLRWLEKLSITHANRDWYGVWWLHELRMDEKYQPPPEGWAASIAVLRSLQSHLQQCANTSRTTDSTGWLPATFCQQCLKSSIQNGENSSKSSLRWLASLTSAPCRWSGRRSWRAGQEDLRRAPSQVLEVLSHWVL